MGCNSSVVATVHDVRTAQVSFEEDNKHAPVATVKARDTSAPRSSKDVPPKFLSDISLDELTKVQPLASGGFSVVYSCVFRGKVAVLKTPRMDCVDPEGAVADLKREIATYRRLASGGGNARLCKAFGSGMYVVNGEKRPFIVLERLKDYTLGHVLNAMRRAQAGGVKINKRRGTICPPLLSLAERLQLGLELAQSLVYLHDEAVPGGFIIHRDLKPNNIGFTREGHVKVIDLGLSAIRDKRQQLDEKYEMTGETGSKRFMAPEVCKGSKYNEKADVYSFSILLWEMCALAKPYARMGADEHYREVIENGLRPQLPKSWPERLKHLLESCWHDDPDQRPNARTVMHSMEKLVSQHNKKY
ncbi:unnamed protein product [Discosporangium mesarthrocarpum]